MNWKIEDRKKLRDRFVRGFPLPIVPIAIGIGKRVEQEE
jgi:hypothetical protein